MKNIEKLNVIANMMDHYSKFKVLKQFKEMLEFYNDLEKIIDYAKEIMFDIEKLGHYDSEHDTESESDKFLDELFTEMDLDED